MSVAASVYRDSHARVRRAVDAIAAGELEAALALLRALAVELKARAGAIDRQESRR
jgi:hypothetical protein